VSLHADASTVLAHWDAPDEEQDRLRRDYLEFLAEHPDAMTRSCVPGHLTASALILRDDRSAVLLTLHPKFDRWLQTGGHCEPVDATLRDAAAREAREESGITGLELSAAPVRLDRHRVGCHGGSWHLDVQYVALAAAGAAPVMSAESLDLAWWPVDDLPDPPDPSVRALVRAAFG
jgi:8-oxo-dGTP pyrophosphatase MutT (NUDIX family)